MPHLLRKAVIPTAGRGTRLLPATQSVPKELLPIGSVPMLHRAIAELVRGDVREIAIVVSPEKPLVREYLLSASDRLNCQIEFIVQEQPRGVADAILLADAFLANEPFIFFMPDEVCFCPTSPIEQLASAYQQYEQALLALTWVPPEWSEFFQGTGRIATKLVQENLYRITQLKDKSRDRFSSSNAGQPKGAGIGVLDREFLDLARKAQAVFAGKAEFDDVPIWQELVRRDRLLGVMTDGAIVDAGNPLGFSLANRYWLETGRHLNLEVS
ncbi:sugar phosphate nucleotidyltransferase [Synechococcus sp. PCC 7336]|uniref:sugar phosphate nucleotidyltransferase n=1 Tax=Synechococcus sp. PCC 7336 TaxID=195250 RepID=UPI0003490C22|nr:sugar phosphate nucleotidyltransferase [Synechococcus sp. PCC 7336]